MQQWTERAGSKEKGKDMSNIHKDSKIKHNKDQIMNSVNNELT